MVNSDIFHTLFEYLSKFFSLNVLINQISVLIYLIYVETHLKPDEKDEKSDVDYNAGENKYIVKQVTSSSIPLILMVFTNLTIYPFGSQKFLNASDKPELKTFMLENIIGKVVFC